MISAWSGSKSSALGVTGRLTVFAGLALLAVLLQSAGGAYAVERGAYPDEAAHFLNGFLLREYLTEGLGTHPVRFAEDYYVRYPKIAPGAWPPLFHVLLGLFLLPPWPPQPAALFLVALTAAYGAWRLATIVSFYAPFGVALAISVLFLLAPVVLDMSATVMVDLLVAALMLDATVALARYWLSGRLRDAVWFGLAAACCCLTKGNGVTVVLMPVLLIVITRRWSVLRQPGLYVAAAIVVALSAPPLLLSYELAWSVEDFESDGLAEILEKFRFYAVVLWTQLGWTAGGLAAVGLATTLVRRREPASDAPLAAALVALASAVVLFHLVYDYYADRYAIPAVAALLGLIPIGVAEVTRLVPVKLRIWPNALYLVVAFSFIVPPPVREARRPMGYRAAADFLEASHSVAGRRLLVVSDENGEGAFVSEMAVRRPHTPVTVVRGSKQLSGGNWMGSDFELRFSSPAQVTQEIEDLHVAYVLVDASPGDTDPPHWRAARDQLIQAISLAPNRYEAVFSLDPASGRYRRAITVYRVRHHSPGAPKPLRLDLTNSLGKVIER